MYINIPKKIDRTIVHIEAVNTSCVCCLNKETYVTVFRAKYCLVAKRCVMDSLKSFPTNYHNEWGHFVRRSINRKITRLKLYL